MRELDFIDWIRRQANEFDPDVVPVGPGDDCAVVNVGGERLLVTTDQLLDGVHFDLARFGAEAMGRKAMARALSDIAAMAAAPLAAVASVALPKGFSDEDAHALYRGRREIGDLFNCPMVGGDVASWGHPLSISITVLGRPDGIEPVPRSGAAVGDAICVTGSLGGAWLGDHHLTFLPRIGEARALAKALDLHAMIDISDGLALDLSRLCRESRVGAEIIAANVPIRPNAQAGRNISPLQAALGDGEDYELLFTLSADQADGLAKHPPIDAPVACIGRIVAGDSMMLLDGGKSAPLAPAGWEHST